MSETRKAERRSISAICALPNFPHRSTTIVATSEQAARLIPNDIDFLFIDGGHSYEVCHFDLLNYAQKLRGGGGLFVDDYIPDYEGVMRACDEFFAALFQLQDY